MSSTSTRSRASRPDIHASPDSQNLLESIASKTHGGGKRHGDEKQAIAELYREGTLTVRVVGLERIGFNRQLHSKLVADCCRREGRRAQRQREKRMRGKFKGPPLPTPVIIRPAAPARIAPPPPLPFAIGVKRGREEYEDDDEYEDEDVDDYEDDYAEDGQPWKIQKIEYEDEDEAREEEELELQGEYDGDQEYDVEEEFYYEEEYSCPVKLEEYEVRVARP